MTRADQVAAFWRGTVAVALVGAITLAASVPALRLGTAAAALLYLLPVLWAAARAGRNAGLASAGAAAFCYNWFLLEPRYTLRIGGIGDLAAFLVFTVVAVVTSRLAADLSAREREARRRAAISDAEAALAAQFARLHDRKAVDAAALAAFGRWFASAHLVGAAELAARSSGLPPLDAAAAAWALHHGTVAGRAAAVMPSADFRFVPLGEGSDDVLALAADRDEALGAEVAWALARLWVQARDRLAVEAERRLRQEADARDAMRRTLLAALGHDFRTPLTVLKAGLAELGGPAARLGEEVDRLVRLSDDLLATARLESGGLATREPVDLVDALASALPADGGAVRVAIADDLPLVGADPVLLVHVLGNLLDNARRHATEAVTVTARREGEAVAVAVRDDGPGLDPLLGDAIFDPLVAGPDRRGGAGLGLAIARDLAAAMGATLTAADHPDGGACFTVLLQPAEVP